MHEIGCGSVIHIRVEKDGTETRLIEKDQRTAKCHDFARLNSALVFIERGK